MQHTRDMLMGFNERHTCRISQLTFAIRHVSISSLLLATL